MIVGKYTLSLLTNLHLKESVFSSDPSCKEGNAWFTTALLKPLCFLLSTEICVCKLIETRL